MSIETKLDPRVLQLDCAAETRRICDWLVASTRALRRRGLVVAVSGGVDSSVCAALAVHALGAQRTYALLLPEADSARESTELGQALVRQLGMPSELVDVEPTLAAIGCYAARDAAMRKLFPAYGAGWKSKLVIAGGLEGGINFFRLVVRAPDGAQQEARLPLAEYLQIVAATSYKQRVRKTIEYYHADRLNYAVVGTPNRLEYDQGFFVKNGDGSADVKPIAHLYKSQVYALARHLGLPEAICARPPTTDTYSLPQGQDEFFFALPYAQMDLALWACNHGVPAAQLAAALGLGEAQAELVYRDIAAKRRATQYLHARPLLAEPVAELAPLPAAHAAPAEPRP